MVGAVGIPEHTYFFFFFLGGGGGGGLIAERRRNCVHKFNFFFTFMNFGGPESWGWGHGPAPGEKNISVLTFLLHGFLFCHKYKN